MQGERLVFDSVITNSGKQGSRAKLREETVRDRAQWPHDKSRPSKKSRQLTPKSCPQKSMGSPQNYPRNPQSPNPGMKGPVRFCVSPVTCVHFCNCVNTNIVECWTNSATQDKEFGFETSLYSRYYAEACNEWRGTSPRLYKYNNTSSKKPRSGGEPLTTLCPILTGLGIEPQTSRTQGNASNL